MILNDLFDKFDKMKFGAPVRLTPQCHPKAKLDIYIENGKKRMITVCCSTCDRVVARIERPERIVNVV